MSLDFFVGPIVGAIIGGITNGIAIKMLFRPIHPIRILGYTLPFTPGVIPKEKSRIAHKIGQVVSEELLNEEVLKTWLLKEEVYEGIERVVDHFLKEYGQNEKTINEMLIEAVGREKATYYICEVEEQLVEKLYHKLLQMELGKMLVDKIQVSFKEGRFGNLLGPMSFFINESFIENLASKMEPVITSLIEEEGEGIIRQAIEEESHKLQNTSIQEMTERLNKYEELVKKNIIKAYQTIITQHLSTILKTINLAQMVEERILALDPLEVERIILSIMRKELNAIVGFGVLLGAIMGILMNFV